MRKLFTAAWVALWGCCLTAPALAQELITNGGFEGRNSPPQAPYNIGPYRVQYGSTYYDDLTDWDITPAAANTSNANTSSYVASDGAQYVNTTAAGYAAHQGASCVVIGRHDSDIRYEGTALQYEGLISEPLKQNLEADHRYQVSYWVMRLPGSPYHSAIELSITDKAPTYDSNANTLVPAPVIKPVTSPDVQTRYVWTQVTETIVIPKQLTTAWVTIGAARAPQTYDPNATNNEPDTYGIFYAVDDVSILDMGCASVPTPAIVEVNQVQCQHQVRFRITNFNSNYTYSITNDSGGAVPLPANPTTYEFRIKGGRYDPEGTFTLTATSKCNTTLSASLTHTFYYQCDQTLSTPPASEASAYPNPVAESLMLPAETTDLVLINAQGQPVALKADKPGQLDMHNLPNGLYYLQSRQNGKITTQRIEVKH